MFRLIRVSLAWVFVGSGVLFAQAPGITDIGRFGKEIAASLNNDESVFFDQNFDNKIFIQRIEKHIRTSLDYKPGQNEELDEKMAEFTNAVLAQMQQTPLSQRLIQSFSVGEARLSFLRGMQREGETKVILRIVQVGGLNYMEFFLKPNSQGELKIIDCLNYTSGQSMSKLIGNAFLNIFRSTSGLVNQLLGKGKSVNEAMQKIKEATAAQVEGDFQKAESILDSIKKPTKDMEMVMVLKLGVKSQLESQSFLDTIDYYQKIFPKHPCLAVFRVQAETERGNFQKALSAVDALERLVGGDPLTNIARGQIWFTQGEFQKASEVYRKALVVPGEREDVHWALIEISLSSKNFEETVQLFKTLEKEEEMTFNPEELAEQDIFAEFSQSKPFIAWKNEEKAPHE